MNQITTLFIALIISGICSAQTSVWDSKKSFIEFKHNGYTVSVARTNTPGYFTARAEDPDLDVSMEYRGICDRVLSVDCILSNKSKINTAAYSRSKLAKDLPIKKLTEAMRMALENTCPEVEIIYMQTRRAAVHRITLAKAHDWIMEEGFLKREELLKKFDVNIHFVNAKHAYYGTEYSGECAEEAHITISQSKNIPPWKINSQPLPSVNNLKRDAADIIYYFTTQCDKIKKITFDLQNVNDSYYCPEGTKCYLEAKAENAWYVEVIGYVENPAMNTTAKKDISYEEITKHLRNGDFETLKQPPEQTYSFYGSFLIAYSDNFPSCISDPVVRMLVRETKYYDSDNRVTRTEISGENDPIYIEKKYVDQFDEAVRIKRATSALSTLKIIFDVNIQQSTDPIYNQAMKMAKDVQYIQKYMDGKSCTNPDLQLLYRNLYTLMHKY